MFLFLFCLTGFLFAFSDPANAQNSTQENPPPLISLTPEESAWLQAHPGIRIGLPEGLEPYVMIGQHGNQSGILVDFKDELSRTLGTSLVLETMPSSKILAMSRNREIDVIYAVEPYKAEQEGLLQTNVWATGYPAIYARQGISFKTPDDLVGKTVVMRPNTAWDKELIKPYLDRMKVVEAETPLDAMKMVLNEEADIYLGLTSHNYVVTKYRLFGVTQAYVYSETKIPLAMGVRPDWPLLVSILNKGLVHIGKEGLRQIVAKWVDLPPKHKKTVELTAEEQAWLDAHPVITLGGGIFPPLDFVDETNGQSVGIGPDYAKLIGSMLGIKFNLVSGKWYEILQMAKAKKIDGIRLISKSREREKYLEYTKPCIAINHAIVTQKHTDTISSLKDLSHKRVGLLKGLYAYGYMKKQYPDIDLITYSSWEKVLHALINNEVEAVVGTLPVTTYMINKLFISNLKIVALPAEMERNNYLGIRKDWPELAGIINKAIDAITEAQHSEIKSKWVALDTPDKKEQITLTPEEQAWLAQEHTVKVRVLNIPPYIILKDDGDPEGISIDYLKLISDRTGIKFNYHYSGKPFPEALDELKRHQGPDLITSIVRTPEREKSILFSKDYIRSPYVIFTHIENKQFISDIADLYGKKIAVTAGTVIHDKIMAANPDLSLVGFDNDDEAIEALATHKADAYIGNLTLASFLILEKGFSNLKIAGPTPFGDHVFSYGIRNDWPELASIIDKVLASISQEEQAGIRNKYISIQYEHKETAVIIKWVLIIGGAASGIIFMFVFWNMSLKKQVQNRTSELRYQATLLENVSDGVISHDLDSNIISWNNAAEKMYGWKAEEVIGRSISEVFQTESLGLRDEMIAQTKEFGFWEKEVVHVTKDRKPKNIQLTVSQIRSNDGEHIGYVGVTRDITEQKKDQRLRQESEVRFRSTFEQAAVGIAHVSTDGTFLRINQKFCDIVGYSHDEMNDLTFQEITHPDDLNEDLAYVKELLSGKVSTYSIDKRYIRKDAGLVWVNLTVSLIRKENGEPDWFVAVIKDITERKKVQESMRDSEEKFRHLMEQSPLATQIFSIDGRITQVNEAFKRLYGISEEALPEVQENYNLLKDVEVEKLGVMPLIEKAFNGAPVTLPVIEYDAPGTMNSLGLVSPATVKRSILARFYPIKDSQGKTMSVVLVEEDVTDTKMAEQKILDYQKRLKALASQLTIAEEKERSRIAAELHDHVGQTLAFTRIQLARAKKHLSKDTLPGMLDEISQSLLETIQATKDMVFDLSSPLLHEIGLAAAIANWLEEQIRKKHGITTELVDGFQNMRISDDLRTILFRNVRELLANVIRHSGASNVIVSLDSNESEVKIIVHDNGVGFDDGEEISSVKSNSGFGLFSIKERMEDSGGTLTIESEPGKGCKAIMTASLD